MPAQPTLPRSVARDALWSRPHGMTRPDLESIVLFSALARAQGSPVLELGCGAGEALIAVARMGVRATGLDKSEDALALARRRFDELRLAAERSHEAAQQACPELAPLDEWPRPILVRGDAASFELDDRYRLIYVSGNSLTYIRDDDRARCFRCCAAHLDDGGLLAFWDYGTPPVQETLTTAGMRAIETYGGLDLRPWSKGGPQTVVLAGK